MSKYKNLFLRQSYLDAYNEYEKSLEKDEYPVWDYVILTASNEAQAEYYRYQIKDRIANKKLPSRTHYAVIPDPNGKRVGSGGATLNVMKYIVAHNGTNDFSNIKILCIHSGGDSKRVPQYSACGKLFSPVPRALADGRRSTLFDEFIIGMTGVPARMSSGMLVCSGDVLLLFNPLQLDFYAKGAMALSMKENVNIGKNHGVFLGDSYGNVDSFLHKQSVERLTEQGAVDSNNNVNIDTGAVIFDGNLLTDLYTLVDTDEKFERYVNDKVRLSFYADFLYPLATSSTLEAFYKETPEGDFSPELKACRTELWHLLRKYKMKLLRFSPASFIHFGTTKELLNLMTRDISLYSYLEWSSIVNTNRKSDNFAASNSYISANAKIGNGSYIEDSYIHENTVVGENCVISGVTLNGQIVPPNTVLHGLKLKDGKFVVRMYGVNDNPKECSIFGEKLDEPLWTSNLYIPRDTMEKAVESSLKREKSNKAISLCSSFNLADSSAIPMWQTKLDDCVKVETILEAAERRLCFEEFSVNFKNGITKRIETRLDKAANSLDETRLDEFGKKIRLYFYLSKFTSGKKAEKYADKCFETICNAILLTVFEEEIYNTDFKISKDESVIKLPVRVNFGGGWSDTPPYCLENGGTVLNAAIKINDIYPIEVVLRKIPENKIVLASEDNGAFCEFTDIKLLQNCKNPSDPFALHKAALIACGVIPYTENVSVDEITKRIGGGIYLSTQAINIPRGSGLGTSSILSGACVKGIFDFFGVNINDKELYSRVVCMEQIMSTGGGWQDQIGGLTKGMKLLSSNAGILQDISVETIEASKQTIKELNERYAIIYTGQRRLARNLLREVVGKYIASDKTVIEVLGKIQKIALAMSNELKKGDIDAFASLLTEHWELSKKIDAGCTNTCIDQIFISIDDLIEGKMICGAGGGGFLQVVMKKGITFEDLKARLDSVFSGSGVEVWKCEFDF